MTNFEIVTLSLSFILGLAVAHLLSNSVDLFRNRNHWKFNWMPFVWVAVIFILQFQYLFSVSWLNSSREEWTTSIYLLTVFSAVTLFIAGALVLPNSMPDEEANLYDYFQKNGKYAVLILSVYLMTQAAINFTGHRDILVAANIYNFILAPIGIVFVLIQKKQIVALISVLYAFLVMYAFMTGAWSFI